MEHQPAIIRGLISAREETAIFLMLVAVRRRRPVAARHDEPTSTLWAVLLGVQALPFFAALVMSMINVLPIFRWQRAMAPMPDLPSTVLPAGTARAAE